MTGVTMSAAYQELELAIDAQTSMARLPLASVISADDARRGTCEFHTEEDFWTAARYEKLRGTQAVTLSGFSLSEWFPLSPGAYHEPDAQYYREDALQRLLWDGKRKFLLGQEFISQVPAPSIEAVGAVIRSGNYQVFDRYGKAAMIRGGYGCVRLRSMGSAYGQLWFMSATSSAFAHSGVPVALPDSLYGRVIDQIVTRGSLPCSLIGQLAFIPDHLAAGYALHTSPLFLLVERLVFEPRGEAEDPGITASVAVTFKVRPDAKPLSSNDEYAGELDKSRFASAFVEFRPGLAGSVRGAAYWLKAYVQELYDGVVVTDFDEQASRFPDAVFALDKVTGLKLEESELRPLTTVINIGTVLANQAVIRSEHARVDEITLGDTYSNIGSGATIVSRSSLTGSLNTLALQETGPELANVVRRVAQLVEAAQQPQAIEQFNGFTQELERAVPNPARLKFFWNGLVRALPDIGEVGDATLQVMDLFT